MPSAERPNKRPSASPPAKPAKVSTFTMPQSNPANLTEAQRTHLENQERAYIAASRRADRSIEARVVSAQKASEKHRERTGRRLRITKREVENEDMYEEEFDEVQMFNRMTANMDPNDPVFHQRLYTFLKSGVGDMSYKNIQEQSSTDPQVMQHQQGTQYGSHGQHGPNDRMYELHPSQFAPAMREQYQISLQLLSSEGMAESQRLRDTMLLNNMPSQAALPQSQMLQNSQLAYRQHQGQMYSQRVPPNQHVESNPYQQFVQSSPYQQVIQSSPYQQAVESSPYQQVTDLQSKDNLQSQSSNIHRESMSRTDSQSSQGMNLQPVITKRTPSLPNDSFTNSPQVPVTTIGDIVAQDERTNAAAQYPPGGNDSVAFLDPHIQPSTQSFLARPANAANMDASAMFSPNEFNNSQQNNHWLNAQVQTNTQMLTEQEQRPNPSNVGLHATLARSASQEERESLPYGNREDDNSASRPSLTNEDWYAMVDFHETEGEVMGGIQETFWGIVVQ
jgi:hypothetical protein